jgi:hypothetical protein
MGGGGVNPPQKSHPVKSATKISLTTTHTFGPQTTHQNELTVQLDMLYLDSLGTQRIRAHDVQGPETALESTLTLMIII